MIVRQGKKTKRHTNNWIQKQAMHISQYGWSLHFEYSSVGRNHQINTTNVQLLMKSNMNILHNSRLGHKCGQLFIIITQHQYTVI